MQTWRLRNTTMRNCKYFCLISYLDLWLLSAIIIFNLLKSSSIDFIIILRLIMYLWSGSISNSSLWRRYSTSLPTEIDSNIIEELVPIWQCTHFIWGAINAEAVPFFPSHWRSIHCVPLFSEIKMRSSALALYLLNASSKLIEQTSETR